MALINTRLEPGVWFYARESRFNGFPAWGKPLKQFLSSWPAITGLKPGVNEIVFLVDARLSK